MTLYRYEFDSGTEKPHTGILHGLDDLFDDIDQILKLSAYFEDNLPCPEFTGIWTMDFLSFFTEKGNRKFNKAIRKIRKAAENLGIGVNCIKIDYENATILYEDPYQVLTPKPYNLFSHTLHIIQSDSIILESSTTSRKT